jgi:tetratricopeptide (TPR) repeat protein
VIARLLVVLIFVSATFARATTKIPAYDAELTRASDLVLSGDPRKAEVIFRELLQSALDEQNEYYAARSQIGLASCYVLTHQYREAVEHGEKALRYGLATGDADLSVRAALNLSSVYRRMEDYATAAQTLRDLNPLLPSITDPTTKTILYFHAATNSARKGDWDGAEPMFFAGIDVALAAGDRQSAATGWNQLGYMRLQQGRLEQAEAALTEAFRLRRLNRSNNIGSSYTFLGILRVKQGDARSAVNLLDRAIEIASRARVSVPYAVLYYWRAKAKMGLRDTPGALADFDRAAESASLWRHGALPSDGFRISVEVGLNRIYADYVSAGMHAWAESRDPSLVRRMFEVSEQHRSASFRELIRTGRQLPPEYWEALASYRSALTSSLKGPDSGATERARIQLARIESRLGLAAADESSARVSDIQARLGSEEALISFHTAQDKSYVWGITRSGFEAHTIAGVRDIRPLAKSFRHALENDADPGDSSTQL